MELGISLSGSIFVVLPKCAQDLLFNNDPIPLGSPVMSGLAYSHKFGLYAHNPSIITYLTEWGKQKKGYILVVGLLGHPTIRQPSPLPPSVSGLVDRSLDSIDSPPNINNTNEEKKLFLSKKKGSLEVRQLKKCQRGKNKSIKIKFLFSVSFLPAKVNTKLRREGGRLILDFGSWTT